MDRSRNPTVKIKGLYHIREGGGYYRIFLPITELGNHGHDVTFEESKTDVKPGDAELIVAHMAGTIDHTLAPGVHSWWRRLAMTCRRVYELDDDPFELEHTNPAHFDYNKGNSRDSLMHCMETADLITASVPPLAERMAKHNPNVVVLKNRIDESLLTVERPRRDKVIIGWAGGPSHYEDMPEAAYGLRRNLDWHNNVEVHFIGADMTRILRRPVHPVGADHPRLLQADRLRHRHSPATARYLHRCEKLHQSFGVRGVGDSSCRQRRHTVPGLRRRRCHRLVGIKRRTVDAAAPRAHQ